jgi:hypothetical protein
VPVFAVPRRLAPRAASRSGVPRSTMSLRTESGVALPVQRIAASLLPFSAMPSQLRREAEIGGKGQPRRRQFFARNGQGH